MKVFNYGDTVPVFDPDLSGSRKVFGDGQTRTIRVNSDVVSLHIGIRNSTNHVILILIFHTTQFGIYERFIRHTS